jgi:hypothetical protein
MNNRRTPLRRPLQLRRESIRIITRDALPLVVGGLARATPNPTSVAIFMTCPTESRLLNGC